MPAAFALAVALVIALGPSAGLNGSGSFDRAPAASSVNASDATPAPFVNATRLAGVGGILLINEVELNPEGADSGNEWVELYNPGGADANASNFALNISRSDLYDLPRGLVVAPGETAVIAIENATLQNVAGAISLLNSTDLEVIDSTPSLVDTKDDGYTWQRSPDGNDEWKFAEGTPDALNEPAAGFAGARQGRAMQDAQCTGSAGCVEGIAVRIVDGGTLYVSSNGSVYKVELALVKVQAAGNASYANATEFTRDLCLGSPVLVDQDDGQTSSGGTVVASVYCSSVGLNEELVNAGLASVDTLQCNSSEFADSEWARQNGC